MAQDVKKLFNEDLPAQLAQHSDAAKQIGAKIQINVTGEGGGEWFIDASDSGPKATAGTGEGADATITIGHDDFQKLLENPQANGLQLFFAGKLKVAGNPAVAQKLQKLFDLGKK